MAFAALSTVIAVFENLISWSHGQMGHDRASRAVIVQRSCSSLVLSHARARWASTCLSGVTIPGNRRYPVHRGLHRVEQHAAAGQPGVRAVLRVTRRGWGWDNFLAEADQGEGVKFPRWTRLWLKYGIPALIVVIFVLGYAPKVAIWLGLA